MDLHGSMFHVRASLLVFVLIFCVSTSPQIFIRRSRPRIHLDYPHFDDDFSPFGFSSDFVPHRGRPAPYWPFNNEVPSTILQRLGQYIASDVMNNGRSHIVDIRMNVTNVYDNEKVVALPQREDVDDTTFNGSYYYGDYLRHRGVYYRQQKSSYGVSRIADVSNDSDMGTGTCENISRKIINKECNLRDENTVECEWKFDLKIKEKDNSYAKIMFQIQYEKLKNSMCLREKQYEANITSEYLENFFKDKTQDQTKILEISYGIIFKWFPAMKMKAVLSSTGPVGMMKSTSYCSGSYPCKCDVQFDDSRMIHKILLMIHMGLTPIFEGEISGARYKPKENRQYDEYLLYWKSLTELDFSNSSMGAFDEDYLKKVSNVQTVNLAYNGLSEIPKTLQKLPKLKTLNLAGNTDLNPQKLSQDLLPLKQLKSLDLSHLIFKNLNDLKNILSSVKLQEIYLRDCQLTNINREIFRQQPELETLALSGNSLSNVPRDLIVDLPKLKVLDLSENNLRHGPGLSLNNIKLQTLDLSKNSLTSMENIITSGFVNELNLMGNQIENWDDKYIFQLDYKPWVNTVNLANNKLTSINWYMQESLKSIKTIELANNKFDCKSCDMLDEMKDWLHSDRNGLKIKENGVDSLIMCVLPESDRIFEIKRMYHIRPCVSKWDSLKWFFIVPTIVISIPLVLGIAVYCKFRREFNHFSYIQMMQKSNRRRAELLHEMHFEYDVYLVYNPDDADFANSLKIRLEKCPQRYRVLVTRRDFDGVSDEVLKCRHVVIVTTNKTAHDDIAKRGVERANFWLLTGKYLNIVLLMMEGVNFFKLYAPLRIFHNHHDHIDWPTSLFSDEKQFNKLVEFLGPSNYETWQKVLHPPPPPTPKSPRFRIMASRVKNSLFTSCKRDESTELTAV